ncbi:hypothetical protein PGB90_004157 [Kerria lacca]
MIRKRLCQFLAKFLLKLSVDAYLDCKICDIIIEIMTERIKDKVPIIRIQAVLAIFRLQDKNNKNCPIQKTLINCIETDTCAEVRKVALSKVSLMQKCDIKIIIDRIDDLSEKVRMEAFQVLSKMHLKQFTIEQRKRLLSNGLYDNNEGVKNTVKTVLLKAWLKRMDGDFLKLLESLDLNVDCIELITKVLMSLFDQCSLSENISEILKSFMDKLNVISYDKLTCESAFFWRCCVFHSSKMVNERNNYQWDPKLSYDATQIGLLPDLSVFCEYIKTYYNFHSDVCSSENPWKKREQEFILIQLIELCKVFDYSDEVGRKELKMLCLQLLRYIEVETIRPIIELYFMLQTNLNESISKITELINDILYPNNQVIRNVEEEYKEVNENNTDTGMRREEISIKEQNIKYKIAQLEVQLDEMKEVQEEAVLQENYATAEKLKNDILCIRKKIDVLKNDLFNRIISISDRVSEIDQKYFDENDEDEIIDPLQNLNVDTVTRCIVILREMLHLSCVKYLTPELRTLFQVLVLPAVKINNHIIAPVATEVLGSFCLRDKSLAREFFTMFFALCGNSDNCVSALRVIFDFLLCFGPNMFSITNFNDYEITSKNIINTNDAIKNISNNKKNKEGEEIDENNEMISGYTFITVLVDLLDDEFIEVRLTVIHGLCKLMATGKLKSVKVLTRLILVWFHPCSRESVEIRDCLNFFFPFFAKHCRPWSLQLFENAIIPTMLTLFNAPIHNPLYEVDQKCVIKVLCDINHYGDTIHCNLAVLFCNSIIDLSESHHQAVLLKGLCYLDLSSADISLITTLSNLLKKIIRKFKIKKCKKLANDAEKLKKKVISLTTMKSSTTFRNHTVPIN